MFVCLSATAVSCSQALSVFLYVVFYCLELLLLVPSASGTMILFLAYSTISFIGKVMYVRVIDDK